MHFLYWDTAAYGDWTLYLAATDEGLAFTTWPDQTFQAVQDWVRRYMPDTDLIHRADVMVPYRQALLEVLEGHAKDSDPVPLDLHGTDFQVAVWNALREITPGQTLTYGDIARRIGRPDAVRATARAIAANPVAFLIPCHRVIGKNGSLTGYRGGLPLKERLLQAERTAVG